ncbi:hypothetical protein [Flavobacterium filum]|uniref:hypothetical protein n=1 Tax=Flavobacterium filum TaxID=370974 RepID=UPI00040643A8|nr:hypothetical protein [Flavobacterium filum]
MEEILKSIEKVLLQNVSDNHLRLKKAFRIDSTYEQRILNSVCNIERIRVNEAVLKRKESVFDMVDICKDILKEYSKYWYISFEDNNTKILAKNNDSVNYIHLNADKTRKEEALIIMKWIKKYEISEGLGIQTKMFNSKINENE